MEIIISLACVLILRLDTLSMSLELFAMNLPSLYTLILPMSNHASNYTCFQCFGHHLPQNKV